jgi:large subunit ribosomal protein L4
MQWDVVNLENEKIGTVELADSVFGVEVRRDILARAVNWQLAKRRAGTHKVKTRKEVSGTTKKPFRQKGTGRARQGSMKGPHMRGGGVVFGPVPRDHSHALPKKVVLDKAELEDAKTRVLGQRALTLGWGKALIIDGETVDTNFARAARNLPGLDLLPSRGANVYDILRHETLVLTRTAVDKLVERLT